MHTTERIRCAIRDVPDFPKPGIIFKDITPILADPELFRDTIDCFIDFLDGTQIDTVIGIDARGFIFGGALALRLNAGFVPMRKQGKLPWKTVSASYSLEYGDSVLELHRDAVQAGEKVLLIDDLLATGGTAAAALHLISQLGGETVATQFLVELDFLKGREKLTPHAVHSVLHF